MRLLNLLCALSMVAPLGFPAASALVLEDVSIPAEGTVSSVIPPGVITITRTGANPPQPTFPGGWACTTTITDGLTTGTVSVSCTPPPPSTQDVRWSCDRVSVSGGQTGAAGLQASSFCTGAGAASASCTVSALIVVAGACGPRGDTKNDGGQDRFPWTCRGFASFASTWNVQCTLGL